jgi:hypothetical protein
MISYHKLQRTIRHEVFQRNFEWRTFSTSASSRWTRALERDGRRRFRASSSTSLTCGWEISFRNFRAVSAGRAAMRINPLSRCDSINNWMKKGDCTKIDESPLLKFHFFQYVHYVIVYFWESRRLNKVRFLLPSLGFPIVELDWIGLDW